MTHSGEGLVNAFIILASSLWAYKRFIEPKHNTSDINVSINGNIVPCNGRNFLEISSIIKNLSSKEISMTPNRSKLKIFISQSESEFSLAHDVTWKLFATRPAFELYKWIEAGDALTDHWRIDISAIKSQTFRIEISIAGKKDLCRAMTIVEWDCFKSPFF
jgi:hypothetical protein